MKRAAADHWQWHKGRVMSLRMRHASLPLFGLLQFGGLNPLVVAAVLCFHEKLFYMVKSAAGFHERIAAGFLFLAAPLRVVSFSRACVP